MLQFDEQGFDKNRLVAWVSEKLKQQGVMGLKEAPFFCGLIERLPILLQDQYSFEKVFVHIPFYFTVQHKKWRYGNVESNGVINRTAIGRARFLFYTGFIYFFFFVGD